jgi:hypothetical protein
MEVRDLSRQLEIEKTAKRLVYEELQAKLIDNTNFVDYTTIQNKIVYQISWRNSSLGNQKEVCVTVEKNSLHRETSKCGVLE